ncbi:MAG: GxxExxY protein [Ignavibacteria bacterium]|nr:GxxExxY protein [Ignavibacteria bacterium]
MSEYLFQELSQEIIGAAMEVHSFLGPGMLESAYEECLLSELKLRGLKVDRQVAVPVVYKDSKLDCGYRIDILVENKIIVELKAIEAINEVHEAQVLTYLRFSKHKVGLLINFNVKSLKTGIRRFIL